VVTTDLARPGAMAEVIDPVTNVVVHLAAAVSAAVVIGRAPRLSLIPPVKHGLAGSAAAG
jgi:hypothetical protein